jgi:hypothetical protein
MKRMVEVQAAYDQIYERLGVDPSNREYPFYEYPEFYDGFAAGFIAGEQYWESRNCFIDPDGPDRLIVDQQLTPEMK